MPALPATMTAIEITKPGGPEVLKPTQRPVPTPGAGEVLVKIVAACVNREHAGDPQGMGNLGS